MLRTFLALSFLVLATSLVSTAQTPLLTIGEPDSLRSEVLDETRMFWIHLPADGIREGVRYPVLYLLDGETQLGGMAAVLSYYMYSHAPEMIVVAIANGMHRDRDLTVSKVETVNGWPMAESGGADRFLDFMADELIPYIDATYPTTSYRTLVGHSYGGLFTVNTLLQRPDLFSTYIAMDPSLGWDYPLMMDRAREAFANQDFTGKTLFMSIANEIPRFSDTMTIVDVETDTTEFSLGMRSELEFVRIMDDDDTTGLRGDWKYYERDLHGSVPLPTMRDGLLFAFDWYELESPSIYNDPSTPTETLVELIQARAERLSQNFGYPMAMEEDLLVMLGFMARDMMEQPDKAESILELAVQYYPENMEAREALESLRNSH